MLCLYTYFDEEANKAYRCTLTDKPHWPHQLQESDSDTQNITFKDKEHVQASTFSGL